MEKYFYITEGGRPHWISEWTKPLPASTNRPSSGAAEGMRKRRTSSKTIHGLITIAPHFYLATLMNIPAHRILLEISLPNFSTIAE